MMERATKKVHIFTGERKRVKKPKNAPAWMPAKIWKPNVKIVGVEKIEDL
ncbi:MAG: non-histone chromosomal MC1 family protein [Methanotrichaceae archaeon]